MMTGIVVTLCVGGTVGVCALIVAGRARSYYPPSLTAKRCGPGWVHGRARPPERSASAPLRRQWAEFRREELRQRPWEERN
ncbi:MAG: hypothetical protein JWM32_1272 [Verrucomicrobia bacterium]|nr:hypothetical protein [Verrucomicrobiota bacterium]